MLRSARYSVEIDRVGELQRDGSVPSGSNPRRANYLWGCVFSPRGPRAKRLWTRIRIALQTPTASQLTWFWVAMGNTQGSRGFTFPGLTGKQARIDQLHMGVVALARRIRRWRGERDLQDGRATAPLWCWACYRRPCPAQADRNRPRSRT